MHAPAVNPRLVQGNFYGKTLRQHQAGGFNLSETRYRPGSTLPRHSHESHYVCLVLKAILLKRLLDIDLHDPGLVSNALSVVEDKVNLLEKNYQK